MGRHSGLKGLHLETWVAFSVATLCTFECVYTFSAFSRRTILERLDNYSDREDVWAIEVGSRAVRKGPTAGTKHWWGVKHHPSEC